MLQNSNKKSRQPSQNVLFFCFFSFSVFTHAVIQVGQKKTTIYLFFSFGFLIPKYQSIYHLEIWG